MSFYKQYFSLTFSQVSEQNKYFQFKNNSCNYCETLFAENYTF